MSEPFDVHEKSCITQTEPTYACDCAAKADEPFDVEAAERRIRHLKCGCKDDFLRLAQMVLKIRERAERAEGQLAAAEASSKHAAALYRAEAEHRKDLAAKLKAEERYTNAYIKRLHAAEAKLHEVRAKVEELTRERDAAETNAVHYHRLWEELARESDALKQKLTVETFAANTNANAAKARKLDLQEAEARLAKVVKALRDLREDVRGLPGTDYYIGQKADDLLEEKK